MLRQPHFLSNQKAFFELTHLQNQSKKLYAFLLFKIKINMPVSENLKRQESVFPMPQDMTEGLIKSRKKVSDGLERMENYAYVRTAIVDLLREHVFDLVSKGNLLVGEIPTEKITPLLKTEEELEKITHNLEKWTSQENTALQEFKSSLAQNDEAQTGLLAEVERIMQALLEKAQKIREENRLISMPGIETKEQFDMKMLSALDALRRYGQPKTCIFLSLMNLQEIAAREDKASMDQIYKKLGMILTDQIRASDSVANLGEGTFGLILEGQQEADDIDKKLHDIMQAISTIRPDNHQDKLQIGASATLFPDNGFAKSDSWKNVSLTQLAQGIMSDMQQEKFFLATKIPEELPEQFQPKETIYGRTIVRIFPTDYIK